MNQSTFTSDYYYFIILSILSSKIYDIIYVICIGLFHLLLWEKEKVSNSDTNTKAFCNNLLMEISKTYYISTNGKTRYNNMIIPIGFIVGRGGYIAYIEHEVKQNNSWTGIFDIFITIHIYGWWSTKILYKSNVIPIQTKGKYNMIMGCNRNERILTLDIPDNHFHKNSIHCAKLISQSLPLTFNNTGVYLLYGKSGTGKTKTGLYLVNFLNKNTEIHNYINTFDTDSFMEDFHISHYQSKVKDIGYYILIVDEVDEMLHRLYKQNKKDNQKDEDKNTTQNIKQKWNNFMDYIHYMKNVIIILTTNKSKAFFDEMDESLFREYRITGIYEFSEKDVVKV